ncbi:MAG: hypothetical protein MPN21_17975 [Thermoanaerobaculia bacterium]|nr:hypothetical protein [Thermoanaerobaculia bacterium]
MSPIRPSRSLCFGRIALLGLVCVSLTACPDSWSRKSRSPVSAIWIGVESGRLEPSDAALLQTAGIEEAFVEMATLTPEASEPIRRREQMPQELGLPVHLVVTGSPRLPADEETLESLAETVAEAVRQLRFEAESRGWLVLGVCFDLEDTDLDRQATLLKEIRGSLDELFVSSTVRREQLTADEDEIEALASAVDFLIAELYGQRPGQADVKEAWDLTKMEKNIELLEELDVPYQVGVVTLGTASYASRKGAVKAQTTAMTMQQVMSDRSMRLRPGFALEGTDRRVYVLRAEAPARVNRWELITGEMVRVVRAATYDLEELHRLLSLWPTKHHLGQVYYRLPGPEEGLSLPVESLAGALDTSPATPELVLDVSVQRRVGRGWLVRFIIENLNREFTELSFTKYNYIEVRTAHGAFAAEQRPGDFYSYDLFLEREEGAEPKRTIRNPNLMRLQVPVLEADQRVSTGDILIQSRRLELSLEGRFLLPDGRVLDLGPAFFRDGELTGKGIKGGSPADAS